MGESVKIFAHLGSFKVRTHGPAATKLVPSPYSIEESEVESDPELGRAALLFPLDTGRQRAARGGAPRDTWRCQVQLEVMVSRRV